MYYLTKPFHFNLAHFRILSNLFLNAIYLWSIWDWFPNRKLSLIFRTLQPRFLIIFLQLMSVHFRDWFIDLVLSVQVIIFLFSKLLQPRWARQKLCLFRKLFSLIFFKIFFFQCSNFLCCVCVSVGLPLVSPFPSLNLRCSSLSFATESDRILFLFIYTWAARSHLNSKLKYYIHSKFFF